MKIAVKKLRVFLGFLFLIILFSGFISAESCEIRLRSECQTAPWNNNLMGLSSVTDAHGQIQDAAPEYDYVLCCDFQRTNTCDGANKIIGLSDSTNAHAEIPSLTNYLTHICYGQLECRSTAENCGPNEMLILSLLADTNAHIGGFLDYATKICCAGICEIGHEYVAGNCEAEQVAYWANINGEFIDKADIIAGTTILLMVLKNSGLAEGAGVSFDIHEDDSPLSGYIKTINAVVDTGGDAIAEWAVSQEDLDIAWDSFLEGNELEGFYFKVIGAENEPSGALTITLGECKEINYCRDYATNEACGVDSCEVSEASVQENNPSIICGEGYTCYCDWVDETCGSGWTAVSPTCGNGIEETDEECDDGNTVSGDGCSDSCTYELLPTPCPEGTTLCSSGICSVNCDVTEEGVACNYDGTCDSNEGCACADCDGQQDECASGFLCSLVDTICCSSTSDGICNPYCSYVDTDCAPAVCGNGIEETDEECDDSNTISGDGCSSTCTYELLPPPCPEGTTLCSNGTCSLNCDATEEGVACDYDGTCDSNEGCACMDCDGQQDECASGFLCSIIDTGCCDSISDGICNPYCSYVDTDCQDEGSFSPHPSIIGSCFFNEDTNDNCDDGFLTYSWAGFWTWDIENIFSSNPDGDDYLEEPVGTWHYDPERVSDRCVGGSNSIACPVQVQLPFFTWETLLATIIVFGIIYWAWGTKKKKKRKKRK